MQQHSPLTGIVIILEYNPIVFFLTLQASNADRIGKKRFIDKDKFIYSNKQLYARKSAGD